MNHKTGVVVFLLCVTSVMHTGGHSLDVCSSCHANATCDNKIDGSGKVCNCKYGFVGNGRTFCQDKDECQIGTVKICGQHTSCHNTYGSYYCTCLSGYRPSNNMATFIPNDGTHCQDINECRISGVCGEGALCKNLEGSFECRCQTGYKVHNGAEPFHPHRDKALCKVVDCGQPVLAEDSVLVSITSTTYGGFAKFKCDQGFVWRRGDNSSVCGASGQWTAPSMACEEILCGNPQLLQHTVQKWNGSSTVGSTVTYSCKSGFQYHNGSNVSLCTINGKWTKPSILCKEINCGVPHVVPYSVMLWDERSTLGSKVVYQCNFGYRGIGNKSISFCMENGQWEKTAVVCQEIHCGKPMDKLNAKMLWDGTARVGSAVYYECNEGFYTKSLKNVSKCDSRGLWEDINPMCEGCIDQSVNTQYCAQVLQVQSKMYKNIPSCKNMKKKKSKLEAF